MTQRPEDPSPNTAPTQEEKRCDFHTAFLCYDDRLQPIANHISTLLQQRIENPSNRTEKLLNTRGLATKIEQCACDYTCPSYINSPEFSGLLIKLHPAYDETAIADQPGATDRVRVSTDKIIKGQSKEEGSPSFKVQSADEIPTTVINEFQHFIKEYREATSMLYRMRKWLMGIFSIGFIGLAVAVISMIVDIRTDLRETEKPPPPTAVMSVLRSTHGTGANLADFTPTSHVARAGHYFQIENCSVPDGHHGYVILIYPDGVVETMKYDPNEKFYEIGKHETIGPYSILLLSVRDRTLSPPTPQNYNTAESDRQIEQIKTMFQLGGDDAPSGQQRFDYTTMSLARNLLVIWSAQNAKIEYFTEEDRGGGSLRAGSSNLNNVHDWSQRVIHTLKANFGDQPEDWSIAGMTFRVNGTPQDDPESVYPAP
ncbi:MAG: hypothetical protein NXI07_01115 [bacterium]|nr:hypothetical protein [bacterium]